MKKLILVTSPPASGKTTLAKALAKAMHETVYLDKDTLIPLSKKIFEAASEPYDRSSDFFEKNIRDLEYQVILDFATEAINYDSDVIINAPFAREIRDKTYMKALSLKPWEQRYVSSGSAARLKHLIRECWIEILTEIPGS